MHHASQWQVATVHRSTEVDMPSYSFKTAATAVVSGIKMQNAAAGECVKVRPQNIFVK